MLLGSSLLRLPSNVSVVTAFDSDKSLYENAHGLKLEACFFTTPMGGGGVVKKKKNK